MTQTTLEIENPQINIHEELNKMLFGLVRRRSIVPIYVKKVEENWEVAEVNYIELRDGEYLKDAY